MVYRGSLQTDDPRDAPRLVRMTPLRTSRTNGMESPSPGINNKTNRGYTGFSGGSVTASKSIYSGSGGSGIDVDRARLIEERRLCRERDIESVEKVILRTTGIKVGAPRLRNINEIRETVCIHATPKIDKKGSAKNPLRSRPKTLFVGSTIEESNYEEREDDKCTRLHYASARPPSSMLANLKDLERLRSTPQPERNSRSSRQLRSDKTSVENTSKLSNDCSSPPPKSATSNAAKIRADIMKIQQMFASPNDRGSRGTNTSPSKIGNSSSNGVPKIRPGDDKSGKSGDVNRTRLLAQKLIQVSRGSSNREHQTTKELEKIDSKRDYHSKDKKMPTQATKTTEKNGQISSKLRASAELIKKNEETVEVKEKKDQPQPPARRRRDSRISMINDHLDATSDESSNKNPSPDLKTSPNDLTKHEDPRQSLTKRTTVLERPDILDGLLKESDRQLEELQNDLTDRSRPRSHWRGFVQSMRLHDVELHSDSEDSKKGKCVSIFSIPTAQSAIKIKIFPHSIEILTNK